MRQYGRDDIDYNTFYSDWMKMLAKSKDLCFILDQIDRCNGLRPKLSTAHEAAIKKTCSMTSNSQRRAQTRNNMVCNTDYLIALLGAVEIYELFPEHTKQVDKLFNTIYN